MEGKADRDEDGDTELQIKLVEGKETMEGWVPILLTVLFQGCEGVDGIATMTSLDCTGLGADVR